MSQATRYTIIGAGNGGRAMAAHLALMDFPVVLYNRTPEHVAAIKARGGIDLADYDGGQRVLAAWPASPRTRAKPCSTPMS